MLLAADLPGGEADLAALQRSRRRRCESVRSVAFIADPARTRRATGRSLQLFPTTSPQDEDTDDLVHTLRDDIVPAAVEGSTADVMVGGFNPSGLDFADYMGRGCRCSSAPC